MGDVGVPNPARISLGAKTETAQDVSPDEYYQSALQKPT